MPHMNKPTKQNYNRETTLEWLVEKLLRRVEGFN